MRVDVIAVLTLCVLLGADKGRAGSSYGYDGEGYDGYDGYDDNDDDYDNPVDETEIDTFDFESLPGQRVEISAHKKNGYLSAAMELEARELFADFPSGNVPRTRTTKAYIGTFKMAMGNAYYFPSALRRKLVMLVSKSRLATYSKITKKKVWDAYEANSGGKLNFVDKVVGGTPIWRSFKARTSPVASSYQNRRLITALNRTFGVGNSRSDKEWGLISRSAKRGNGDGGRGGGVVAIIRNAIKPSLAAHELNHNLGLGHAKKGVVRWDGKYTSYVPYKSDFSLSTEGSLQLNGEIASCVEQHFLQWNKDEDYQFIEFNKSMGLRNVGRGKSSGRTEPVSLVWENPYGGQHWFCYGVHGTSLRSKANRGSFPDRSGITHEQTAPLTSKCAPLQDPYFYGKSEVSVIGSTGLTMHVEEKFDQAAGVKVRFTFDEATFNMPAPLVELWTESLVEDREHVATSLWVYFRHAEDRKRAWISTPYVLPINHLKLRCGNDTFTHNATKYTDDETNGLFRDLETGVYMWPRRCGRYKTCTSKHNKMNRQVRIDISPPLTETTDCTLIIDKRKRLYKHISLTPPP
ncbi:Hypothetical Protein FCC1311_032522 [Hondaea fermentalgiana]|uniref:Uncharacterized protein n=1 Tax=Hondaea fermentalgiana TaxID=2315210 RepID=A0A2R5G9N9_9STRA|nr:Hypothetical Protein FCC1311_032522 [Hondaea fermentalgiana]|eukprot:GBG27029.1 Hypothetical Protein FCC1311_032522 [Hondaea fermentalgiana]